MSPFQRRPQTTEETSEGGTSPHTRADSVISPEHPIISLQQTVGNQAVARLLQRRSEGGHDSRGSARGQRIQPKLTVNEPGDTSEREADRVSEQVTRTQEPSAAPAPVQLQTAAAGIDAPPIVDEVLSSPGQPLDTATRALMEPRFGRDFSDVRVHTGSHASESAEAVCAKAYTVGSDLVFAEGQYAPGVASGRQLIAHELTHVAQQRGSVLRRQPAPAPRWKELFPQFQAAQTANPATATTLAEQLAAAPRDDDDLRFQGLDVIAWLQSHGKTEKAVILLFDLRALLAFDVGQKQKLPNWVGQDQTMTFAPLVSATVNGAPPPRPIDPRVLIDAGKSAARAGQHREALQFFGSANEILSLYAFQVTRGGHAIGYGFREGRYAELSTIYNALRDIYQVYPQLEREARAAGKEKRADALHARGEELRKATLKQFAAAGEAELAETDFVSRPAGAAYSLVGANTETTELTQLPGLSAPSELDSGVRVQDLSEIQTALMKQADVQEELRAEPEIAKEFPKGPIDLHDNTARQKVWKIMFGVYEDRDGDGALASLMSLIGRYLKAYTIHTTYNVRDFGTSYLKSSFPTDLAGRAVRDCGVYALMVAWDVYLAAKAAGSAMDLTFSLAIMLDHVILLIEDKRTKATYIVSNDTITRAETADAPKETARAYASERNLEYLVSPEIDVPLGSLTTPQKDFEKGMWNLYEKNVQHAADVARAVDKKLPVSVFAAQEELNTLFKGLDTAINNLRGSDDLAARLDALLPRAFAALILFERIAKADKGPDPKHPVQVGLGRGLHPLVRVALAVLHVREVGGTLNFQVPGTRAGRPAQLGAQDYVEHVDAFFQSQMAANRDAGKRGNF